MKKRVLKNIFEKCIQEICKEGPIITDNELGELTCGSCGTVLVEKTINGEPENHYFTKEDYMANTRFGPKIKLSFGDMGLSTFIGSQNKDSSGKQLPSKIRSTFYRLRKQDKNSKSQKNRVFNEAFVILDGIRSRLSLPESVIEKSAYIYRKAVAHHLVRGRSRPVLVAASVYTACRFTNTPRTLKDIADAANVKKKILQKTFMSLVRILEITLDTFEPINFITRLSTSVNVSEKTRRDAIYFINRARELELTAGKNPIGIASAALYFSCVYNKENVSQLRIAEAAGITTVTIRNDYQVLIKGMCISPLDLCVDKSKVSNIFHQF
jgi:transcription initiation factor TFIIB